MNWINRINKGVDFIESNLLEEADYSKISKEAETTPSFFKKMFHMFSGTTVAEYVRRRRLTLAAQEIASGSSSIEDIAFKYGYRSQASFAKAFTKLHGFSPVLAREAGIKIKAYPRLFFHSSSKGESMDYKIIELKETRLAGKSLKASTRGGENFRTVPAFWEECMRNGTIDEILKLAGASEYFDGAIVGAVLDYSPVDGNFVYMISVESGIDPLPGAMEERIIGPHTYAVFETMLPQGGSTFDLWQRIYSEWLPSAKYVHAEAPDLEILYPPSPDTGEHRSEIWLAVAPAGDIRPGKQ